jgi:hypothetical protein
MVEQKNVSMIGCYSAELKYKLPNSDEVYLKEIKEEIN